jgi:hypothetical protein
MTYQLSSQTDLPIYEKNTTQALIKNNPINDPMLNMIEKYSDISTKDFLPELMSKARELVKNIVEFIIETIVENIKEFANDECKKFNAEKLLACNAIYYDYKTIAELTFPLNENNILVPFIRCTETSTKNTKYSYSSVYRRTLESIGYPINNAFINKGITIEQIQNTLRDVANMNIIKNDPRLKGFNVQYSENCNQIIMYETMQINPIAVSTAKISVSWNIFNDTINENEKLFFNFFKSDTDVSNLYKTINIKTDNYMYQSYRNSKIRQKIITTLLETIKNLKTSFRLELTAYEYILCDRFLLKDTYFNGLNLRLFRHKSKENFECMLETKINDALLLDSNVNHKQLAY